MVRTVSGLAVMVVCTGRTSAAIWFALVSLSPYYLTGRIQGPAPCPSIHSRPAMQRPASFRELARQTIFFVMVMRYAFRRPAIVPTLRMTETHAFFSRCRSCIASLGQALLDLSLKVAHLIRSV